ncbi:MAG TPA: hypothetical protein VFL57_19725 [Bryobacteraceae bacterium]|nr:hypothetical protein [Bryobacteraceae bacterium]
MLRTLTSARKRASRQPTRRPNRGGGYRRSRATRTGAQPASGTGGAPLKQLADEYSALPDRTGGELVDYGENGFASLLVIDTSAIAAVLLREPEQTCSAPASKHTASA